MFIELKYNTKYNKMYILDIKKLKLILF